MYRYVFFLFVISKISSQTLKFSDLRRIHENKPNCEHKYLLGKGFRLVRDSSTLSAKCFYLSKVKTDEAIEAIYYVGIEGDYRFTVHYYLPIQSAYAKFLMSVKTI